jgi:hypothetical protein
MSGSRKVQVSLASIVPLAGCMAAAAAGPPSGMNVNVVNTPTVLTQSLDERGRNPYQVSFACTSAEGACTAAAPSAVPANARLVIELASVRVFVPPGQKVQGVELSCSQDIDVPVYLPPQFVGTVASLGDVYYATQRVIFYCEAGETPRVTAQFTVGALTNAAVTVTGYLVNP